jgi:hypothetical protein
MANGSLSFTLPEEQDEFDKACKAHCAYSVLHLLDCELRNHLKHDSHPDWHGQTVEEIRQILYNLTADYGVEIN